MNRPPNWGNCAYCEQEVVHPIPWFTDHPFAGGLPVCERPACKGKVWHEPNARLRAELLAGRSEQEERRNLEFFAYEKIGCANYNDHGIMVNVAQCARCDQPHADLRFARLRRPANERMYWASCPTTNEPIMLVINRTMPTEVAVSTF